MMKRFSPFSIILAVTLLCLRNNCMAMQQTVFSISEQLEAACPYMLEGLIPEARDIYGHVLAAVMHVSKAIGIQYSTCRISEDGSQFELAFNRREKSMRMSCSLSAGHGVHNDTKFSTQCDFPDIELLDEDDSLMAKIYIGGMCRLLLNNQMPIGNNLFTQMYMNRLIKSEGIRVSHCGLNDDDEIEMSMESHGVHICDMKMALLGYLRFSYSCRLPDELGNRNTKRAYYDWLASKRSEL